MNRDPLPFHVKQRPRDYEASSATERAGADAERASLSGEPPALLVTQRRLDCGEQHVGWTCCASLGNRAIREPSGPCSGALVTRKVSAHPD
jgi:hypothetical protein